VSSIYNPLGLAPYSQGGPVFLDQSQNTNPNAMNSMTTLSGGQIVDQATALSPAPQGSDGILNDLPTFSTTVTASMPTGSSSAPSATITNNPVSNFRAFICGQSGSIFGIPCASATTQAQAAAGVPSTGVLSGFSWGRVGGFALGLILIAAGLYLFGKQDLPKLNVSLP